MTSGKLVNMSSSTLNSRTTTAMATCWLLHTVGKGDGASSCGSRRLVRGARPLRIQATRSWAGPHDLARTGGGLPARAAPAAPACGAGARARVGGRVASREGHRAWHRWPEGHRGRPTEMKNKYVHGGAHRKDDRKRKIIEKQSYGGGFAKTKA